MMRLISKTAFNIIKTNVLEVNINKIESTKGQKGGRQVADSEMVFVLVSEYTLKSAMFFPITK